MNFKLQDLKSAIARHSMDNSDLVMVEDQKILASTHD